MSEPSQALARLISAEAIRDLIYHCAMLLDAGQVAEFSALFAGARIGRADRNGELLSVGLNRDWPTPDTRGVVCAKHCVSHVQVQVARNNQCAVASSSLVTMRRTPRQALQVAHSSRCFDQLEYRDGLWCFSQRLIWTDALCDEACGGNLRQEGGARGPARLSHEAHGAAVEYRHYL